MSIKVRVPTPLRSYTLGVGEVAISGNSLAEAIGALDSQFPGIGQRICDESGELRRFVNIYINGEDVRFLQGLTTPLKTGDEVSIVPAMAGG